MQYTTEQKHVILSLIKGIVSGNEQVQTLGGYAGTGKTTVIRQLQETLKNKGYNFATAAYTGKATNVLKSKGIDANTVHSLIYQAEEDPDTKETNWHLIYKDYLSDIDGFIVDEASMIGKSMDSDLRYFNKPIIYIGDHGQLESIEGGDFNLMKSPMYRLEEVHRNAGEIALFSEHIRKGNPSYTFKAEKKVQFVNASAIYNKHLAAADQVIVAFNRDRVLINERVRKYKKLDYVYLAEGEKVICLRNNRVSLLFNGQQGIVQKISKKNKFDFLTDDGLLLCNILYDPDSFGQEKPQFDFKDKKNPFDYAYAITCHKAQGDEWDRGIVFEKYCQRWEHKRWAYTAASRFRVSLIWAVPD